MTDAEIMSSLGGYRAVADYLGEDRRVVHKWARRGFPARYWPSIARMAQDRGIEGVTVDLLERPMWKRSPVEASQ